jgi:hypothetical protein
MFNTYVESWRLPESNEKINADSLRYASEALQGVRCAGSTARAGSLLSFIVGKDRTFLISHAEDQTRREELDRFREGSSAAA